MPEHMSRGQRATCGSLTFLSTVWVLEIEPKSSNLDFFKYEKALFIDFVCV